MTTVYSEDILLGRPKPSFCKVTGCLLKHSTYLHQQSAKIDSKINPQSKNEGDEEEGSSNGLSAKTVT